jgi:hypothetical protein
MSADELFAREFEATADGAEFGTCLVRAHRHLYGLDQRDCAREAQERIVVEAFRGERNRLRPAGFDGAGCVTEARAGLAAGRMTAS